MTTNDLHGEINQPADESPPPQSAGSISQLILYVKRGSDDAAQRLWERYFGRLLVECRKRLCRDRRRVDDEEDVVLSVMNSFFNRARDGRFPELSDRNNLWRLLITMTSRKAVDHLRREQREKRGGGRVLGEADLDDAEGNTRALEQVISDQPTPRFAAQCAEELDRILKAMATENPQLKDIAILKMEGYTNGEIAEKLGVTERTIERKLSLIRKIWTKRL